MKKTFIPMIALMVMILAACEQDNGNGNGEDNMDEAPKLSLSDEEQLIEIPEGLQNSDDPYAVQCQTYIQLATNFSSFGFHFDPPDDANTMNHENSVVELKNTMDYSYSYTWGYEGQSFTMYWLAAEESDRYTWDIDIEFNGTRYEYMSAWESLDNTQGQLEYNFNWVCMLDNEPSGCEDHFWIYNWNTASDGTVTYEWLEESETGDGYSFRYEVISNPDQSGQLKLYEDGTHASTYVWNADGSGSFTDESSGETHSWDAA